MKRNEYIDPGNLEFHYKREEREKTLDPSVLNRDKKIGFFKKNKQLKFILLDVVLIVLIFLILQPLIGMQKTRKNIYGCNFRLESMLYEDSILISIKVEKKDSAPDLPETVTMKIYVNNETQESASVEQKTDFSAENRMYIRTELMYREKIKDIHAEIIFGDKDFRLHNTLTGL
ncbi:MAG: hypothetical protein JW874_15230 [Spirochaetales bacterium]|nr:hypothetical protein [Spirochaetales bacterium]